MGKSRQLQTVHYRGVISSGKLSVSRTTWEILKPWCPTKNGRTVPQIERRTILYMSIKNTYSDGMLTRKHAYFWGYIKYMRTLAWMPTRTRNRSRIGDCGQQSNAPAPAPTPTPRDVHMIIPRTCGSVLLWEIQLADGISIADQQVGRLAWIIQVGPVHHQGP